MWFLETQFSPCFIIVTIEEERLCSYHIRVVQMSFDERKVCIYFSTNLHANPVTDSLHLLLKAMEISKLGISSPEIWKTNPLFLEIPTGASRHPPKPLQTVGPKSVLNGWLRGTQSSIVPDTFITDIPVLPHTRSNLGNNDLSTSHRHTSDAYSEELTRDASTEVQLNIQNNRNMTRSRSIRSEACLSESDVANTEAAQLNPERERLEKERDLIKQTANAVGIEGRETLSKLKEIQKVAAAALKEASEAREQTLQARREALAARKEAMEAQTEAMKARNEALKTKREMAETKKTLAEVQKAIAGMVEEMREICNSKDALFESGPEQLLVQQSFENNRILCKCDGRQETPRVKDNVRDLHNSFTNTTDGHKTSDSVSALTSRHKRNKSPVVTEPHVIIKNAPTRRGRHGSHSEQNSLHHNSYSDHFTTHTSETVRDTLASPETIRTSLTNAHGLRRPPSVLRLGSDSGSESAISAARSPGHTAVMKHLPGAVAVMDVVEEIAENDHDLDAVSPAHTEVDESVPSDKESGKDVKDSEKAGANAPPKGSFIETWGDFIGRISTLMITIVTAVNTAEAMIDSFLAAQFVKAGTFAFLLLCIHLPVGVVMVWLLLKEKVQQIKDGIKKVRSIAAVLLKLWKRFETKREAEHAQSSHGEDGAEREQDEEIRPATSAAAVDGTRGDHSVFIVETKSSTSTSSGTPGLVNQGFNSEESGCNPAAS